MSTGQKRGRNNNSSNRPPKEAKLTNAANQTANSSNANSSNANSSNSNSNNSLYNTNENRYFDNVYFALKTAVEELNVERVEQIMKNHLYYYYDHIPSGQNSFNKILLNKLEHISRNDPNYQKLVNIFIIFINNAFSFEFNEFITLSEYPEILGGVSDIGQINRMMSHLDEPSLLIHYVTNAESLKIFLDSGLDPNHLGLVPEIDTDKEIPPLLVHLANTVKKRKKHEPYQHLIDCMVVLVEHGAELFAETDSKILINRLIIHMMARHDLTAGQPIPNATNESRQDEQFRIDGLRRILTHSNVNFNKLFKNKTPRQWQNDLEGRNGPEAKETATGIMNRIRMLNRLYITLFTTEDAFIPAENAPNNDRSHLPQSFVNTSLFGVRLSTQNLYKAISLESIESTRQILLDCLPQKEDDVYRNNNNNNNSNVERTYPHFFFHEHGFTDGLTSYAIDQHVDFKGNQNQKEVQCPVINCTGVLKRDMLTAIMSPAAWGRFTISANERRRLRLEREEQKRRERTGLNLTIPLYNAVLQTNEEHVSFDNTRGYHWSMCPFCLQPVVRSDGCSYMGHAKPTSTTPSNLHPWCRKEYFAKPTWEKYFRIAKFCLKYNDPDFRLIPLEDLDDQVHLEFCITCGGPTQGHHHFDLTRPGMFTSNEVRDYTTCDGVGRVELIVRMMVIRDFYRQSTHTKPHEERIHAAQEADTGAIAIQYVMRYTEWADVAIAKYRAKENPTAENLATLSMAIHQAIAVSKQKFPLRYKAGDENMTIKQIEDPEVQASYGLTKETVQMLLINHKYELNTKLLYAREREGAIPPWWVHDLSDPKNKIWHPQDNTYPLDLTQMDNTFIHGVNYLYKAEEIMKQPRNSRTWGNNALPAERFYKDDYAYQMYEQQKELRQTEVESPPVTEQMTEADPDHMAIHEHNHINNVPQGNRPQGNNRQGGKRKTRVKRKVVRRHTRKRNIRGSRRK